MENNDEEYLDIEHALKTYLITSITKNRELNGVDIVERFFHSTSQSKRPLNKDIVLKSIQHEGHYQYNLYKANKLYLQAWVLVEVMGFGDFLRFYEFYFTKYPIDNINIRSLMGSLHSVRRVRNASAHNNAFLFDLANTNIKKVNKYIKEYAKSREIGELFYTCNKVHDVLSLFLIHENFVKGKGSRRHRIEAFKDLTEKSLGRFEYLDSNNDIMYFFRIMNIVIDRYEV